VQPKEVVYLASHAPRPASCLQLHGAFAEDSGKSGGVRTVGDGALARLENVKKVELASAAETADTEVLMPCMLAGATNIERHNPHRNPAELVVLIPTPTDHSVPLSIDQPLASAALCTMTRDAPYREAVSTLTWDVLATCQTIAFAGVLAPLFAAKPRSAHSAVK
jgi:hypothetical protein